MIDLTLIIASIHFVVIIQIYTQIDIRLQIADELNKKKDVKVMKVIHDLKNPVTAISQLLNDDEQDWEQVKESSNREIEDLTDMLDNLRLEFKSHHLMDVNEASREINCVDFIDGFKRTHSRLAKNGNNSFRLSTEKLFPKKLWIQRINVKRVVNNLISNSLKHTKYGKVEVAFKIEKFDSSQILKGCIMVGSHPVNDQDQISIEVMDNGKGIAQEKMKLIFDEQHTDESNDNWDGTGLGLPIVKYICQKTQSFIIQSSTLNTKTSFKQYIPYDQLPKIEKMTKHYSVTTKFCKFVNKVHECDAIIFAEDNPNILKKQEKTCVKNNLSYFSFNNGRFCLDQIKDLKCTECNRIVLITDNFMPQMGGIQLAREIKKIPDFHQDVKIVLVTAEEQEDKEDLFDYIQYKPLPGSKILQVQNEIYLSNSINTNTKCINYKNNKGNDLCNNENIKKM